MSFFGVLRCNGCYEIAHIFSNTDLINKPHGGCSEGGVWRQSSVAGPLQTALPFYSNLPVSAGPRLIADVAPQTPIATGAVVRTNTNTSLRGQGSRRGRGRGHAQGRGNRGAPSYTTNDSLDGRSTRDRSQSPKRDNAGGYRDRGKMLGQRDEGWLPDGSAYVYDGNRLHPGSWHKFRLDHPRSTIMEKHWDSWKYYRTRGHGHKIPKALEMPHIMPPHPIFGPEYTAKMVIDGQQDPNPSKGRKSKKIEPAHGRIIAKQASADSKTPTSTDPRTSMDKYCLGCKSKLHWHHECTANSSFKLWTSSFNEDLLVDLTKFQREIKDSAPRNIAELIEHIFVTCLSLRKYTDWSSARNEMQLAIYNSFQNEEIYSQTDMPRSKAMLYRIGQLNLIVDDAVVDLNKIVKRFNVAWLKEFRDQGLGITTELGRQAEKNDDVVRRLYTTPQPTNWPFPALESVARALHEQVHDLRMEYFREISGWHYDLKAYREGISLSPESSSRLDRFEAHAYQALLNDRARIGVDRSAWLNFIIIPEAPDKALENMIYWRPLFESTGQTDSRTERNETAEEEQGEIMEDDETEHPLDDKIQSEEELAGLVRSFAG